ncbi:hypothetical protein [Novispirillum itersonii]|uniref:Uncharacterized protein n=1 Tax=Novispirillum itersonii TaxID=189 RepID=A0A7X0DM97_NOVIT|nr:hypothetical protein [Novispirillum itersonii]MBB6210843.1 hypothetical protein [Novispirillum itersonii]
MTTNRDNDDTEQDAFDHQHARRLRTVKTIALGMAALIVVGIAALGYGMYSKADKLGKPADAAAVPPVQPVAGVPVAGAPAMHGPAVTLPVFGSITLDAMDSAEIVDVQTSGTILTVTVLENTGPSLHIIDLTAGRVLGRISLKAPQGVTQGMPQQQGQAPHPARTPVPVR